VPDWLESTKEHAGDDAWIMGRATVSDSDGNRPIGEVQRFRGLLAFPFELFQQEAGQSPSIFGGFNKATTVGKVFLDFFEGG
jgi:hypothetical protein